MLPQRHLSPPGCFSIRKGQGPISQHFRPTNESQSVESFGCYQLAHLLLGLK